MSINNEKDLSKAITSNQDTIIITGSIKEKVIKIKATGKVAWAIAIGGIGIALTGILLLATPEPSTKAIGIVATPIAVSILGIGTTTSAISIALAARGVGVLNSLRNDYTITEKTSTKLVLSRKQ